MNEDSYFIKKETQLKDPFILMKNIFYKNTCNYNYLIIR